MTISSTLSRDTARIEITDRFDSLQYANFKSTYQPLLDNNAIKTIEVDISRVDYLDSGALGMLVLLHESAKNSRKTVTLVSIPGTITDILKIANADKLFSINLPSGMPLDLRSK